jgi:hypothetical protein
MGEYAAETDKFHLMQKELYPRLLIMSRNPIDEFGPKGASLGNWFQFWPCEKLALISSYAPPTAGRETAGSRYLLTDRDIRWQRLYTRLKRFKAREAFNSAVFIADTHQPAQPGLLKRWGMAWYRMLFQPRLSREMRIFLDAFKPELIFSCIEDLQVIGWTALTARRYDIPIWSELEDNWFAPPPDARGMLLLAGKATERALQRLLARSDTVFVISPAMQQFLRSRYRIESSVLNCVDTPDRYEGLTRRSRETVPLIIRYIGTVGGRIDAVRDLRTAVQRVRERFSLDLEVHIHGSVDQKSAEELAAPWFFIRPVPPHDQVPALLADSHVLFLCETYDPRWREYVSLALSSKTHLYLWSGVPVIAYGPPWAGVMQYAQERGFAVTVTAPDIEGLVRAVNTVLGSPQDEMFRRAELTARTSHNAYTVCRTLLEESRRAAGREAEDG